MSGTLLTGCVAQIAQGQAGTVDDSCQHAMQERYDAAERFLSSRDRNQVIYQFRLFVAKALHCVAKDRARLGQYGTAVPLFERALKLAPSDPALHLDYGEAAVAAGDPAKGRTLTEEALKLSKNWAEDALSARSHHTLGRALLALGDYKGAKDEFETAVAIEPNFENGYDLAASYILLGDVDSTNKIFAEMLSSYGDTAAIHMQFGRVYGEAHFPEEAIVEFKKAIALDNAFPEAHYSLGASYLIRSGDTDFAEAEAEFHKELALHPNDYFSYSQLGYIAMNRHQLEEAVRDLTLAAKLDPQNPDNFLLLGQIYADLSRPVEAEKALRSAIGVTSDPSRNHYQIRGAHYQLGRLLLQRGEVREGKKEMAITEDLLFRNRVQDQINLTGRPVAGYQYPKVATAAGPANDNARTALLDFEKRVGPAIADGYNNMGAAAAADRNYVEAVEDFEQAAAWNPAMEDLDFNWGRAAFAAKRYREAAMSLGRVLQKHPDATSVREPLAMSRFMTGDFAGTISALTAIEVEVDADPLLGYEYAESLVHSGDYDAGLNRLLQIEKAHPQIGVIHLAIGKAYRTHLKYAEAENELRIATKLRPSDAEGNYELAVVEFELKKDDEAKKLLQELGVPDLANSSENPAVYRLVGDLQLSHGNLKWAIANFEAAAQLDPGDRAIHEKLAAAYRKDLRPQDAEREEKRLEALQGQSSAENDAAERAKRGPRP